MKDQSMHKGYHNTCICMCACVYVRVCMCVCMCAFEVVVMKHFGSVRFQHFNLMFTCDVDNYGRSLSE